MYATIAFHFGDTKIIAPKYFQFIFCLIFLSSSFFLPPLSVDYFYHLHLEILNESQTKNKSIIFQNSANRKMLRHRQKRSKNGSKMKGASFIIVFAFLLFILVFIYAMQINKLITSRKAPNSFIPREQHHAHKVQMIKAFTGKGNVLGSNPGNAEGKPAGSSPNQAKVPVGHPLLPFYYDKRFVAGFIWESILNIGYAQMKKNGFQEKLTIMEVGAYSAKQIFDAVKHKFHVFFFEPSPKNFERIQKIFLAEQEKDPTIGEFLYPFNMAAGATTGDMIDFKFSGGTGDHVGNFDVWNMKPGDEGDDIPKHKRGKLAKIQSIKLDDIVYNKISETSKLDGLNHGQDIPQLEEVFAAKIDTQGYEPKVLEGLKESIANHKIKYILLEYWPKGIDMINNSQESCKVPVDMLLNLQSAGYKLFALPIELHPSAKTPDIRSYLDRNRSRPLNDLQSDCQYILKLEEHFPNENYHIGYWTDILAIAPGAPFFMPKKTNHI